jgi:hypothetical protein
VMRRFLEMRGYRRFADVGVGNTCCSHKSSLL